MRRAVVHVNLDPSGALSLTQVEGVLEALRVNGFQLIAGDMSRHPPRERQIELIHDGDDRAALCRLAEEACAAAVADFRPPLPPRALGVSFISTGTVEDAAGVLAAFGVDVGPEAIRFEGEDTAEIHLPPGGLGRTAQGKLQTALECALNREIRLRTHPNSTSG